MKLLERFWTGLIQVINIATFSIFNDDGGAYQVPLFNDGGFSSSIVSGDSKGGPIFKPPGGRPSGDGSDFLCDYSAMSGWMPCSTPLDRTCWLKNDNGGRFDIKSDYEAIAPQGILRKYSLELFNGSINADGLIFNDAKLFDGKYPGPWLQACWGDMVEITVYNKLPFNGSSIHWHGIRQNQTTHMDGVGGITQCPIAPGDKFVYKWKATQYGSSWYHSHYSHQYADGLVGPLTIHGPTSAPYDEAAKLPLLITDWGHNSAFDAAYNGLINASILLNGRGNVTRFSGITAELPVPSPYTLTFEKPVKRPKRYLLRLINTSFETTFVFSIDNHNLTVVGSDFVPIHPYSNTSVLIGIGQRYHVIVEANPIANASQPIPSDGNFWMRTYVAACGRNTTRSAGYERSGILRYDSKSNAVPTSKAWNDMSLACSDETYSSLRPVLEWKIGSPANGHFGEEHNVFFNPGALPYPLAVFSLEPPASANFTPLRIDYGDPIFLHLNNTSGWKKDWVVIPEDYNSTDWVYIVIAGDRKNSNQTIGAHPIHLHGHDFAILQQTEAQGFDMTHLNLKLDNPPRRDVVLLPRNGFVIIAFKTDNPGSWLMHCHIARHASEGLAMQILERQKDANNIWPFKSSPAIQKANALCKNWNKWQSDCRNYWPGGKEGCNRAASSPFALQDDSGI